MGVILGSSELGLTKNEVLSLPKEELDAKKAVVKATYQKVGADYIIDDMSELLAVVDDINTILKQNKQ